jgi:hypothetical protein
MPKVATHRRTAGACHACRLLSVSASWPSRGLDAAENARGAHAHLTHVRTCAPGSRRRVRNRGFGPNCSCPVGTQHRAARRPRLAPIDGPAGAPVRLGALLARAQAHPTRKEKRPPAPDRARRATQTPSCGGRRRRAPGTPQAVAAPPVILSLACSAARPNILVGSPMRVGGWWAGGWVGGGRVGGWVGGERGGGPAPPLRNPYTAPPPLHKP